MKRLSIKKVGKSPGAMILFHGILLPILLGGVIGSQVPTTSRSYKNAKQHCMTYGSNPQVGVYVVDKCPLNYMGPNEVRRKCEAEDISDPIWSAPATDTHERVTFRNRYCAECHNAPPEALESWLIYLYCEGLQSTDVNESFAWNHLVYKADVRTWGVQIEDRFHFCQLGFDKPSNLYSKVKMCRVSGTSSCLPSGRGSIVGKACALCRLYGAKRMKSSDSHCAVCKGQTVTNEICEQERARKQFSFALLLDVNRSDGDIVGVVQRCPSGEKYDPFFKKCRKLVCAIPGYKMVNGKCKK